ncbi:MAG: MFS transporter [Caldisphaera sp.]
MTNEMLARKHIEEESSYSTGILTSILAGLGWLFDAYVINIYALALPFIATTFNLKPVALGIVASMFVLGYTIGTIGFGYITDLLGRKPTLSISILGYSVITALSGLSPNVITFAILRFLTGVGGGGELPVGATFTTENWPAKHRGIGITLMYIGYPIGYLMAVFAAYILVPSLGWRWIFIGAIIPGLLILIIRSKLEESKRYLIMKKEHEEKGIKKGSYRELFSNKKYLRSFITGALIYISLAYGYYSLSVFLPTFITKTLHQSYIQMIHYMIYLTLSYLIFTIIAGYLSDIIGRKPVAILSALIAGGGGYIMFSQTNPHYFLLYGLLPYAAWVGMTWTVSIAYVNEIFPTRIRGTGFGASVGAGRVISIFAPIISGFLASRIGFAGAFRISASIWLLMILGYMIGPKETKRKVLEEISE